MAGLLKRVFSRAGGKRSPAIAARALERKGDGRRAVQGFCNEVGRRAVSFGLPMLNEDWSRCALVRTLPHAKRVFSVIGRFHRSRTDFLGKSAAARRAKRVLDLRNRPSILKQGLCKRFAPQSPS
jgi:hypothetical protein